MGDFAIGMFTFAVFGSTAITGAAVVGLVGLAAVEWFKYRKGRE